MNDFSPDWPGVLPSLPTPFTEADAIAFEALARVVDFAVTSGAAGLVCLGLAGEVDAIAVPERVEIVKTVVEAAEGRVPVLAGATGENLSTSMRLAQAAEAAGASAIVLPPPGNMRLDTGEVRDFFATVASSVDLPVIVQDAPQYLNAAVSPDIVASATERAPNICGVKLELGPEGIESWRAKLPASFRLFGGSGGTYLIDCLDAGATGVMPASDLTDVLVAVYEAWRAGERGKAEDRFARALPMLVFEMQSMPHSNRCVKYVLGRRGLGVAPRLRKPARPELDERSIARLDRYLRDTVPALAA